MPIHLNYNKENDILLVTVSGVLTLESAQEAGEAILSSTEYPPHVNTIWDLCQVDARNINREFLDNLITLRKQQFQLRRGARLALVANSDLNYGLSRMYEMLAADLQQSTHVFKDLESALSWIKES